MTTPTRKFTRPAWTQGPLYALLSDAFPERITAYKILDIRWLCSELGKSHEAIYKWFRAGRLTPRNARAINALANRADNIAALERVGRAPPSLGDFDPFVYAA